ncbi:MAG: hypothetical protein ACYCOY_05190 [Metallibacterium sp.]
MIGTLSEMPPSISDWRCGSTGANTAGTDMLARITSGRSPPRQHHALAGSAVGGHDAKRQAEIIEVARAPHRQQSACEQFKPA